LLLQIVNLKFFLWNSLKMSLMTYTNKRLSMILNAGKADFQLKPWSNICIHISIKNMVLSHLSLNGHLPSLMELELIWRMTMKSHYLERFLRMNVMRNSDLFKCMLRRLYKICLKSYWEKNIIWKAKERSLRCLSIFKMDTSKIGNGKKLFLKCMILKM
jgi:hypothetical protein